MYKRSFIGLLPVIFFIFSAICYSIIYAFYYSKESREELLSAIQINNFTSTSSGNIKKKLYPDDMSLEHAINYLTDKRLLPKPFSKSEIDGWKVTSDSTAYLVYEQDTFHLTSTYYTLKHPQGITLTHK